MTDDMKAAVELMRENARNKCQCTDCNMQRAVLPWFDGEDARTAAAVAAATQPLADRIAELEFAARVAQEKAEAERDALRAQVADLTKTLADISEKAWADMRDEAKP